MRCLEPEVMYYLCHDYEITPTINGSWSVSKWDRYINVVSEDFYSIRQDSRMNINISAIVGENGSGKSTLVELILRMINNCSIKYELKAESGRLEYVDGVHARLFYLNGKQVCCLSVEGKQVKVCEIATINDGVIKPSKRELTSAEMKGQFFYTLVSNYSHYAYNTNDYKQEWIKQTDEDTCWLKWLFHKNDGYQTPVNLHPYREQGTINIEREKNLSNQRLLYFFINYAKRKKEDGVFKYINGKKPKYLNLRDAKRSKLQEVTLKQFFYDYKNANVLDEEIALVNNFADSKNGLEDLEKLDHTIICPLESYADSVLGLKNRDRSRHYSFFRTIIAWLKEQDYSWQQEHGDSLFTWNSDFKQLLTALHNLSLPYDVGKRVNRLYDSLKDYMILNMCQLQRLEVLDDICDYWRGSGFDGMKNDYRFDMKPELITAEYKEFSQKDKCYHYIVYKTIDVFDTYPSYHDPLWAYQNRSVLFSQSNKDNKAKVHGAFKQLLADVTEEKTHITLKMRQGFYYLKNSMFDQSGKDGYQLTGEKIDDIEGLCLSSERLAQFYEKEDEQNLETLPPPIFERHLLFETADGRLVDMDTFSSGEKQLLNTQSAIIYHLQNLNSIFKDPARMSYPQVNIILEEIELYFHPEYQRCFIYSLINLLESSGIDEHIKDVNILIVTHSPFILSDIPKSNVLFLKDGRQVTDMQENTFGANIHSMLKNAFFLNGVTIGDFAKDRINRLFWKLHNDEITEDVYQEILLVSEPFIKSQLLKMYNERHPHHQMKEMEERIAVLEKALSNNSDDKN